MVDQSEITPDPPRRCEDETVVLIGSRLDRDCVAVGWVCVEESQEKGCVGGRSRLVVTGDV